MSNAKIRAELETRLKTWADAQTPKIPIAFQNVAFTKPADGSPYMEPILMPNATINARLTASARRTSVCFKSIVGRSLVMAWARLKRLHKVL
jgi:hypothetical protein